MSAEAWYARVARDVVTATGRDARAFLHSQLAQDVASLAVGESRWSLLLEPTGRVVALVRVACHADDRFSLDTDPGAGGAVAARLSRFRIRVDCALETASREALAVRGLDAAGRAALLARPHAWPAWREADGAVDLCDVADGSAVAPPDGAREASADELERARIAAAWPVLGAASGADLGTDAIPAETGLVDVAVNFAKGCYPGQELVERMDARGARAPRSLRVVRAPLGARRGDPCVVDGEPIGTYASVCGDAAFVIVSRGVGRGSDVGSPQIRS